MMKRQQALAVRTPLPPDEIDLAVKWPIVANGREYSAGGHPLGVPDPSPSLAHLGAEGMSMLSWTRWTPKSRINLGSRGQSHGDRKQYEQKIEDKKKPAFRGGWEEVRGTPEHIQRTKMLQVNDIWRHPKRLVYIITDNRLGRSLRVRIPMDLTKGDPRRDTLSEIPGVKNNGIGAAYARGHFAHLLNEERPEEILDQDIQKHNEKKLKKKESEDKTNE
jgi:hypothetical protein